jgi:purine-binding chemotaxis protein CheW
VPEIDDEEKPDEEILSFLTFALGKETYGIDIRSVREIILSKQLTRVPNAKGFVTGIMNLRGMVIPVIDAKKRLGFAPLNGISNEESMNIIIVEEDGLRTGVGVDLVEDIVKFSKDMIVMSGQVLGSADSSYVHGMGKTDGKTIVLLDIKSFCGADEHYY